MGIITPDLISGLMLKTTEHSGTYLRARTLTGNDNDAYRVLRDLWMRFMLLASRHPNA